MIKQFILLSICYCIGIQLYTQPAYLPPNYASDIPINYIKVYEPTAPYTNVIDVLSTSRTVDEVKKNTQYFDGLGRPIQAVSWQATPLKKDMVAPQLYDEYGREALKYMPYIATTNDGNFKYDAFTAQNAFNTAQYGVQGESFFYSKTEYEPSPLNRPIKAMAQGNSWVGSNKGIQQQYLINTAADAVRIWNLGNTPNAIPTTNSVYPTGELYKNVTTDEHNKQVIEYKDKEGKVILKQVQIDNITGADHTGYYNTYYIYDDYNQLRYVIQPKAISLLKANSWNFASIPNANAGATIRDELCFYYAYDAQGRMIIKKVPGAGEVHMVYDERDRLVMTQDANLRAAGKWMVTMYDEINRPMLTGLWANANTRAYHETQAAAQTTTIAYPFAAEPSTLWELLTLTGYDDYANLPTASGLTAVLDVTHINSTNFITTYNTAPLYAQDMAISQATKGLPTWSKIKVLNGTNTYLYTVTLYDHKARPIQTKSKNITGGQDVATMQYDFSGKVLRTHTSHQKLGTGANVYTVLNKPAYDHMGRVLHIKKTIAATGTPAIAGAEKTIMVNTYDELGQLQLKKLAAEYNSGAGLEALNYTYNIRGWLLGINKAFIHNSSYNTATGKYFGFELGYDKAANAIAGQQYAKQQYNGNIAGATWKSIGDSKVRKFDYDYDNANRLLKADYNQYTGSAYNQADGLNFNVKMGDGLNYNTAYDENGNIKQMQQWGLKGTASTQIDNLSYNYTAHSNKLLNVIDTSNDATTKLGDFRYSTLYQAAVPTKNANTIDYTYDANGNMVKDKNKDIEFYTGAQGIVYNYLNLPQNITVKASNTSHKGTIEYLYDATGNKLMKKTTEGSITTTTTYTSGYVYESKTGVNDGADQLQYTGHEEGRVRPTYNASNVLTGFVYDYMLKDHLGNVRMVLTEEQKQDVYPAATMEPSTIATESQVYGNLTNTVTNKPTGGWFVDPMYTTNTKVAVLKNASNSQKVGPNIILKVMAGDTYNIRVASGYKSTATPTTGTSIVSDILGLLSNAVATSSGGKVSAGDLTTGGSGLGSSISSFIATQPTSASKPRAYINWLQLNEQFKVISAGSGFEQVGASGVTTIHIKANVPILTNGYLYVYTSNESSNIEVYFDNLQVTHTRGAILEETHYYPFGLTMAGISSKAAGGVENKNKWNSGSQLSNKEFSDGSGLEMYETAFRLLDPQLGRFWQIDPSSEIDHSISQFAYVRNNPLRYTDPLGLDTVPTKLVNGRMNVPTNPNQGDVLKIDNGDNSTSFYNYDPNNSNSNSLGWVGTGMQSAPKEPVTVTTKKKSSTISKVGTFFGGVSLINDIYTNSGYLKQAQNILNGCQFQAWHNGQLRTWKLGFNGNQYVNGGFLATEKIDFLAKVALNAKRLEFLKRGGVVLNFVGVGFSLYDISENGLNSKNGTDLFFGSVAFVPGVGWMISGTYFLGESFLPGGWKGAMDAGAANIKNNREIIPNWNPRPRGGLGN